MQAHTHGSTDVNTRHETARHWFNAHTGAALASGSEPPDHFAISAVQGGDATRSTKLSTPHVPHSSPTQAPTHHGWRWQQVGGGHSHSRIVESYLLEASVSLLRRRRPRQHTPPMAPPEYVRVSLESESSPSSATSVPTHSEVRSFAARKVCLWGDTMPSTVVFPAHTQQQCQPTQCSKGSALARRIPLNMDVTSAPMQRRNK